MIERTPCDLCGADQSELYYSGERWKNILRHEIALVRCRHCGLIYLNPRPTADEIGLYYPNDYRPFRPAVEDERFVLMRWFRRRRLNQRRKLIERYSGQTSGRVLDAGCATGLFLRVMEQAGWQVAGVEPIASAANYARTRFGLDVYQGTLDDSPYPNEFFDVVTFWDVLEHAYTPTLQLTRAAELLRRDGLLAVNVPNWNSLERRWFGAYWSGFDPPRHLYVFTKATLTALLKKTGFVTTGWVCFMPGYYPFIISVEYYLRSFSPGWAERASRVLNIPGVRLPFEPWFTFSNWLKIGGEICVFARKE
jgi:SAM-dependent methyltransferase